MVSSGRCLFAAGLCAVACQSSSGEPPATAAPAAPARPGPRVLAEFTGSFDPAEGVRMRLGSLPRAALATQPEGAGAVVLSNDPAVTPAPESNGCPLGGDSFSGAVRITNASPVPLLGVHAQLLSVTTGYEVCNNDGPPATVPLVDGKLVHAGLGGLWAYGDLQPGATVSRPWKFKFPASGRFTFTGRVVATADLCSTAPCQHAGACTNLGTDYACACEEHWTGKSCEVKKDLCAVRNGGCWYPGIEAGNQYRPDGLVRAHTRWWTEKDAAAVCQSQPDDTVTCDCPAHFVHADPNDRFSKCVVVDECDHGGGWDDCVARYRADPEGFWYLCYNRIGAPYECVQTNYGVDWPDDPCQPPSYCAEGARNPCFQIGSCGDTFECDNVPRSLGSHPTCQQGCPAGLVGTGNAWSYPPTGCADVNECDHDNGGCHPDATCGNLEGGRTCVCKPGYAGNGITCQPVDYCAYASGNCTQWDPRSTCVSGPWGGGSQFACVCPPNVTCNACNIGAGDNFVCGY